MMGFTNGEQLRELFLSCGIGFLFGAYYDVFRILRRVWRAGVVRVFWQDLLFFGTAAPVAFLFLLSITGGVVRVHLLIGVLGGFVAYRYTVGRAVVRGVVMLLVVFSKCECRLQRLWQTTVHTLQTVCLGWIKNCKKKRKKLKKGVATSRENGV